MVYTHHVAISFGDCDPAGIVFYPNYFRWMDATFHKALLHLSGLTHAALCRQLGAQGLGLVHAALDFRAPATDGDMLSCQITEVTWHARKIALAYRLQCADRLVAEGKELRCLFVADGAGLRAGETASLRAALDL